MRTALNKSGNALILYDTNDIIYSTQNLHVTYNILSISIINNVNKTITNYTFANCAQVIRIIVPNTIENIKNNAFENCKSLQSLIFNGNPPIFVSPNIFLNCYSLQVIYYLPENAQYWSQRPWWIPNGVQLLPYNSQQSLPQPMPILKLQPMRLLKVQPMPILKLQPMR